MASSPGSSKPKGWRGKLIAGLQKCGQSLRFVLTPSIISYFGLSSLLYLVCGLMIITLSPQVQDFFCAVDAQHNETTGTGRGCENCGSDLLLCEKEACWRYAMNLTLQIDAATPAGDYYADFSTATIDVACNSQAHAATNVQNMITLIERNLGSSISDHMGCKQFHCKVYSNAITHPDLSSPRGGDTCTNSKGIKKSWEANYCVCQSYRQAVPESIQVFCDLSITTTTTTTTTAGTAAITSPSPSNATSAPSGGGGATGRLLSEASLGEQAPFGKVDLVPKPEYEPKCANGSCWEGATQFHAEEIVPGGVLSRRLQQTAPAPAGAANNDREDYVAGEWSSCACYQQCVSGVRTRVVDCFSVPCKEPMPPVKEVCTCNDCAHCSAATNLQMLSISYLVQGGVAAMVFLSFVWFESKSEEKKEDVVIFIPYLMRPIGFFCKYMPILVRVLVLMNCLQLAFMLFLCFVPSDVVDYMPDCSANPDLKLLVVTASGIWTVQLFLGRFAKSVTRLPPYLYNPERGGGIPGIKHLRLVLRALGP